MFKFIKNLLKKFINADHRKQRGRTAPNRALDEEEHYMKKELLEEFIAFAKAEYGLTVEAVESDEQDSFEKIFGGN